MFFGELKIYSNMFENERCCQALLNISVLEQRDKTENDLNELHTKFVCVHSEMGRNLNDNNSNNVHTGFRKPWWNNELFQKDCTIEKNILHICS